MRGLTYGPAQTWIAILFALIVALLVLAFIAIGRSSRREVDFDRVKAVGYGVRSWWFVGLAALLVCGVVLSLFQLPYSRAGTPVGAARTIGVEGGQYYWKLTRDAVPAGHVRLSVTSADVNHGLGIYSPRGELIGSVQAMPGYTNTLDLQLDVPGEYTLSCLELCGAGHHKMHAILKVTRS
ncbi:MAG TPA: hypothetical protein VNS09_24640 [Solirubrobacter sp.]|nr:hypothetical protein [Solirubrobacter sp.]